MKSLKLSRRDHGFKSTLENGNSCSISPEVCGAANSLRDFLVYIQKNSVYLEKRSSVLKIPQSKIREQITLKKWGIELKKDDFDLNSKGLCIITNYLNYLSENSAPATSSPLYPFTSQKQVKTHKYNFIDLFCGAGGLSLGFEQAGLNPILALDNDKWSTITYKYNRPWLNSKKVVQCDIMNFEAQDYSLEGADVLSAGIPCQPFSLANQQKIKNDPRNNLYVKFLKCAYVVRPKVMLIENVNGFTQVNDRIISEFDNMGYATDSLCIDASSLGMAQNRKRLIYIAVRDIGTRRSSKILSSILYDVRSCLNHAPSSLIDAIGDLPSLEASRNSNNPKYESEDTGFGATFLNKNNQEQSSYIRKLNQKAPNLFCYNHKARFNNERDIQIFSLLKQGEDSTSESISHIMPYKRRAHVFKDKYFRLFSSKPCKTITAHMRYDCNSYIHPSQSRGLTAREAARVQGFPDNYVFCGTFQRTYQQVGNAVPPPLARVIGSAICANI